MKKVFCVKDEKAGQYYEPFCMGNTIDAQRTFMQGMRTEKSMISQYPEDFNLYCIGEYDELTGLITPQAPVMILTGKEAYESVKGEIKC